MCTLIGSFHPLESGLALIYYENTMFIETHGCEFNLTLTEGTHYLIIDNTGYTAGLFYRGRPTATGQYAGVLPESTSPFQNRTIFGEFSLKSQEYLISNITLTVPEGDTALSSFVVVSSNKVSVFLTNVTDMTEFQEGVDSTTFNPKPVNITPWVIVLAGVLIIGAAVTIYFVVVRQQRQDEAIYKVGGSPQQFVSSHKAPSQQVGSIFTDLGLQKPQRTSKTSVCPHCGTQLLIGQQYCSHCGQKVGKE